VEMVLADRPSSPWASQSSTAFWTMYLGDERIPSRSSSWRSWSLSLTSVLVRPLTLRRMRLPSGPNPKETEPRQRPGQPR
jgi:hypothetical protein